MLFSKKPDYILLQQFWCCLVEADLTDAVLSHMNATCANFRDCKMPSFGFEHAILIDTDFQNVNISPDIICPLLEI